MSEPMKELAIATLMQARSDLVESYIIEAKANKMLEEVEKTRFSVNGFLNSTWFESLCDGVTNERIDPEQFKRSAQMEAEFLMWRRGKGCSKCKHQCPYKLETAWDVWSNAPTHSCAKNNAKHYQTKYKRGKKDAENNAYRESDS